MRRALVFVVLLGGCYLSHERDEDEPRRDAGSVARDAGRRPDAGPDARPAPDAGPDAGRRMCTGTVAVPVDLLLVVDSSGSMREEQDHLAEELPRLVRALVDPPDEDGDGRPDWNAIPNLHLGVIDTEVQPGCALDPILRTTGTPADPTCAATYPRFLSFPGTSPDAESFAHDGACLARVGARGCGLEQPLDAMIKALLPSADRTFPFVSGSGHGDRENAGFLRPDSLLAVVILTDEDDCSSMDPEALLAMRPEPGVLPPCSDHERDRLFPTERYVDALLHLRGGRRERLAFAVIAGVPEFIIEDPTMVDYEELLSDTRMVIRLDRTTGGVELVNACSGRFGEAVPARRLVEVARGLDGQSAVASICQPDYAPVVGAVARLVGTRACDAR